MTPIMKRTQELSAASKIIFIDSTSSCDASHTTLTVLLTATNAGGKLPNLLWRAQCKWLKNMESKVWLLLRFQNVVLYASVKERERRLLIIKKTVNMIFILTINMTSMILYEEAFKLS